MRRAITGALLFFAVLSLVLTYPLALHLADAVEDRQDALLNVWITAWDGHQLVHDPLSLFDANIFHPYPRTLAYSELLLGNALLALPITAISGNPVLGYNVALLLSFVLSGFGTYLLVLKLTRSQGAGLMAGVIFAFSAYRMTNLAQAQLLITQWMPLALLSLYQLMRQPRPRHTIIFVLFFCLQALSSFYYAILLTLTLLGFVMWEWGAGHSAIWRLGIQDWILQQRRVVIHLLVAVACSALLIAPFALPYFQVQSDLGFERSLADNEPFSASLRQYLLVPSGSLIHGQWLPSDDTPIAGGYPVDALFPGLIALALGIWGLVRGGGHTRWFFALLLLASFVLSLGPRLYVAPGQPASLGIVLPYAWLYAIVPGFKALRAPVRFNALVMLSLSVLAGYGLAALLSCRGQAARDRKRGQWRWRSAFWVLLSVGLVVLESSVWPAARTVAVPVGDEVAPVYRWLADQAPDPVLELPMAFAPGGPQLDYQYLSTYHWQTTPDGYSGFIPPKHGQVVYEMERFPSEPSVSLLQALGVRWVIIHTDRMPVSRWEEMQRALAESHLAWVEAFGTDQVYEVRARSFTPSVLEVRGYFPPRAVAGEPYTAYVIALNRDSQSYAVEPTDVIRPTTKWTGSESSMAEQVVADVPLVTVPRGGAAVVALPLTAPTTWGSYEVAAADLDGPLGAWTASAGVEIGGEGDSAFPVPARLESWEMPATVAPGETLPVKLAWRALGKIDAYYSVYVKLLDNAGDAITGWDGQPRNGEAPTLLWVPGETVDDDVTLAVPADASLGEYTLEVGMYRARDLARCLTLTEDGVPMDRIVLGTVRVVP